METEILIAILSILFGIAVIVFPRFLNLIVGGYFVLQGILILIILL